MSAAARAAQGAESGIIRRKYFNMCGRFTLSKPKKIKAKDLGLKQSEVDLLRPRYNITPTQKVGAILADGSPRLEALRWGLIPRWAKDEKIGSRMINARAETIGEKPVFRGLLRDHRCVVLADGFYEWAGDGKAKQPYFIHLKHGEPFTFAGLWSAWKNTKGEELKTCTLITCAPNELMEQIHNRMPVILDAESRDEWLNPDNQEIELLTRLLHPYPKSQMEAYPVSKIVNSPTNDTEDCIKPA